MKQPTEIPDAQIKAEILRILEALDNDGRRLSRGQRPEVTNGTQVVTALLVGCLRLSRGIQVLVHRELPEEALILARTLLEDSTLLAFLHKHEDQLEDFALTVYWESLVEDRALEAQARSLDMLSPQIRLPRIEADVKTVKGLLAKRGLKKPPPIPSLKNMLKELNAEGMYWYYKKASQMVHSTTGLASRLDWRVEGEVGINMEGGIGSTLVVGHLATEAVMTALIAGGLILGWDVQPIADTRPKIRSVHQRFRDIHAQRTGVLEELQRLRDARGAGGSSRMTW
jgi:hypothetical protein